MSTAPALAPIPLPAIVEERLDNGATVVVARREGVPLAAVRLTIRAGSALDPPGRFGLANLVCETMRRGTKRRSGARVDEEIESLGAELGAGVDEDATYLGLSAPVESLGRLLDVVADVAVNPTFPPGEAERVRRREVAALTNDLDEIGLVADRAMLSLAYGVHPYGHPVEGRLRDLRATRRADGVAFHRRWFGPAATTLVIVGKVDAKRALDLARRKLGRWRSGAAAPPDIMPPGGGARTVYVVDKPDATQSQVRIALPAIARNSPEFFPAVVAGAIVGGGFTSRLMESIRVNRGLSYGVRARFSTGKAGGLFFVSSFTKVETTGELVQVALDELARFADGGPTGEELARAQSFLAGLYPLSLETHDQLAEKLSDVKLYGYPIEHVTRYRELVRAVTATECREVARRHFPLEGRGAIVVAGPAKQIARQVAKFGPVEVVTAKSLS